MEYRQLGRSGLRISTLTLGTMGFGGGMFAKVGTGDVADARRQIDLALDAGVNTIEEARMDLCRRDRRSCVGRTVFSRTLHGAERQRVIR